MTESLADDTVDLAPQVRSRLAALAAIDAQSAALLARLIANAGTGLASAYDAETGTFAQTVRAVTSPEGVVVRREGTNLRYAAMAALGLDRLDLPSQHGILAGATAREVALGLLDQAAHSDDPGAVALALWASAEVAGEYAAGLVVRLERWLASDRPLPTVDVAWMLTAAIKAAGLGDTTRLAESASALLADHAGPSGLYPHLLRGGGPRWRAHVGSFADQVYPLQANALHAATAGRSALTAAELTALTLCDLQGSAGQWWWHYDSRGRDVVEAFPVYSVHQHAMAPMVLGDLADAGGEDHLADVALGVSWLSTHPEVVDELVSDRFGLVWRKVGRREPRKAARGIGAVATAVRPGWRTPGLDRLLPATVIDHECRPYELGWLLYAWLPPRHEETR